VTPHRPHADRRPGEPVPGREAEGRVTARGTGGPSAGDTCIARTARPVPTIGRGTPTRREPRRPPTVARPWAPWPPPIGRPGFSV
jgi:hypothetical protein